MNIVRCLMSFVLICCIYNIIMVYSSNKKFLGADNKSRTTYFVSEAVGHYRRIKNGKITYVKSNTIKREQQ